MPWDGDHPMSVPHQFFGLQGELVCERLEVHCVARVVIEQLWQRVCVACRVLAPQLDGNVPLTHPFWPSNVERTLKLLEACAQSQVGCYLEQVDGGSPGLEHVGELPTKFWDVVLRSIEGDDERHVFECLDDSLSCEIHASHEWDQSAALRAVDSKDGNRAVPARRFDVHERHAPAVRCIRHVP